MEGLRTRALSGENVGGSACAADHVGAGAGEPDFAGVSETGRHPRRACNSDIWSRVRRLSGVTVCPGDLAVLSI